MLFDNCRKALCLDLSGTGIDPAAMERLICEQIYSLPGTTRCDQQFSILLTGSRAIGAHTPNSDVDVDVLCPQEVYERVQPTCLQSGLIGGQRSFFCVVPDEWWTYFGRDWGRPHFSLTPLETASRQIEQYEDVPLWIWTRARILIDPGDRFRRIIERFNGYPDDVRVRKIKYRWLMAGYWEVEGYPYHHNTDDELLPATAAVVNAVNDLLRLFFLVEDRPFPYAEKLMRFAAETKLGQRFRPMLNRLVALACGDADPKKTAWQRLDETIRILCFSDESEECRRLEQACAEAMIAAGVDAEWVRADYQNIDELLLGELGPLP